MKYALIAAGLLLAACASDPGAQASNAGGRDCFRDSQVSGFNVVGDNAVKVNISPGRDYLLTVDHSAHQLATSEHIAIAAPPSGLICTGNGLGVNLRGGDVPGDRWTVTSIARAPEERATAP
jgi:hypothetical protein